MPKKVARTHSTMSVGNLMGSGRGKLGQLYEQWQLMGQLQKMLYRHWPELEKAKVRVVGLRRGTLILATPSTGSAVRIRHALPDIIHSLQKESLLAHLKLTNIKIRHQPQEPTPPADQTSVTPPSPEGLLKFASIGLSSRDPRLKEAFRKLVVRLRALNERQ